MNNTVTTTRNYNQYVDILDSQLTDTQKQVCTAAQSIFLSISGHTQNQIKVSFSIIEELFQEFKSKQMEKNLKHANINAHPFDQ